LPLTYYGWLLHPFLIGLYFVLTLAAANSAALQGWGDLVDPVLISVGFCGLFWVIGFALSRSPQKASLLSLLWITAFSLFGYVSEGLRPYGLPGGLLNLIGGEPGLGALFAIAIFGPSLAICRMARQLESANRYVTVVAVLLVAYTTIQLYGRVADDRHTRAVLPQTPVLSDRPRPGEVPDIYLIVLDKYTSSDILAQHFGFDNTSFETFLRSRGFVIPRHSRANYPRTQLALASMLNLDYIQDLPRPHNLDGLIESNRLVAFLKSRGYRFVFFPTAFSFTSRNRHADLQIPPQVRGEFQVAWERTTMLPELVRTGCALLGCRAVQFRLAPETADLMDWKFGRLVELAGGQQPTFVFAHLILPHEPFLYWADCTHRPPYWPANAGMLGDKAATRGYLDQVSCTNLKIGAFVDSIIARSHRPPVILLQAYHGHGRLGRLPDLKYVDRYRLTERMATFAAYRVPGLEGSSIDDTITPVNIIRLVLRHYLGADLPPIDDASYWSSEDRPFEFVRIEW
jgi:hypothetical protein